MERAAGAFAVKLQFLDILGPKDIETALRTASKGRADAVLVLQSGVATAHRTEIAKLAIKSRLPAIYPRSDFVEDGGLMSLRRDLYRLGPPRRYLRGQDFEGSQARRSSGGAAEEVRLHHQSQSRQADWPDDSAQCAGAGGSGHKMTFAIFDCRFSIGGENTWMKTYSRSAQRNWHYVSSSR
jgi:hypothetical protein